MLELPPLYDKAEATLLTQGLTNHAYCLTLDQQRYFYRQGVAQPEQLFIDRHQEHQAIVIAHAAGLFPEVHYRSADGQQLALVWCDEPAWTEDYFSSETGIVQLAQLAARVHSLPAALNELDLATYLHKLTLGLATLSDELHQRVQQLQQELSALSPVSFVLCHNDINPTNLLGNKPWLIDWEYAAMGDPAFELAAICRAGQFNDSQLQTLLAVYQTAGGCSETNRVRFMLVVVDMVSLLWCERIMLFRPENHYFVLRQQLYQSLGIQVNEQ
jgi:thiamine kinase